MRNPLSASRVTGLWRGISIKGSIDVFKAGAMALITLGKFSKSSLSHQAGGIRRKIFKRAGPLGWNLPFRSNGPPRLGVEITYDLR